MTKKYCASNYLSFEEKLQQKKDYNEFLSRKDENSLSQKRIKNSNTITT
jgi:hypothetical protein